MSALGLLAGLGRRTRWSALAGLPLRAPLPPGGAAKKGGNKDKGPRQIGELSKEVATGCGLLKGEPDPPIRPDSEYPAWLFELLSVKPSAGELEKAYREGGLTMEELKRLWRLKNKGRIREQNMSKQK